MYIDTHAHLSSPDFSDDLGEILLRANREGVSQIINVTCDFESIDKSIELFSNEKNVYLSFGIHPSEAKEFDEFRFKKLTQKHKIVAIGEIGLDFYWKPYNQKLQEGVFVSQLEIAKDMNLPVIVHSRSAESEALGLIQEIGVRSGVLHCYTGDRKTMLMALRAGLHISFAGMLTYSKNNELRSLLKNVPLDRLLLETDCPYLPPSTMRGQRNEPSFLPEIAKTIAKEKGIGLDELAKQTSKNAYDLFGIRVSCQAN